jgi:hypothetical protein
MQIMGSHRRRRVRGTIVAAVVVAAVAAVVTTAALGASAARLRVTVSPVATIGRSRSTLTVRGVASCPSPRLFAISAIALEPTSGASVHGAIPGPGASRAPTCNPPRKSFRIVVTQQGEKNPLPLKRSSVRVCFVVRSWWKRLTNLTLDARCWTLKAH